MRGRLPEGTATFVMTDVLGSTPIWEGDSTAARAAFERHDSIMGVALEEHGGHRPKDQGEGDSVFAVFESVRSAVDFAIAAQRALTSERWPPSAEIRVRMAVHTGEAELFGANYKGSTVHRCARLRGLAHGGQILLSASTAELLRAALPAGTALRDLGTHELRGLKAAEHVFQLDVAGLPTEFPSLRSLANPAARHNLPMVASSFVGRDRETADLLSALNRHRLVTVVGAGGTGKTRLALQVAADLVDGTGDGVWLVELAPVTNADHVVATVANVLGVPGEAERPIVDAVVDALRTRRLLLVLDNCEHVVDEVAKLVDQVLRSCPRVAILATSREPLLVDGEHRFRLAPLAVPPGDAREPDEALVFDSVNLFVQRATAQQPSFTLDRRNVAAVATICRRLDGIPLAIELAAARVRALSADEIARRLDERLRLLTSGSRSAPDRQQTLRALIDWSYDLLNDAGRSVVQQLSVFAGTFDLDAVENIVTVDGLDDWEVVDRVASLVDKSLVETQPVGTETRYRLLESVRQYAQEKLAECATPTEQSQLVQRHALHYLGVAQRANDGYRSGHPAEAQAVLDREYDNLRIAVARSFDDPDPDLSYRLGDALFLYWYRCRAREGIETLTAMLDRSDGRASTLSRGRALYSLASLMLSHSPGTPVDAVLEDALAIADAHGDDRLAAESIHSLGTTALRAGDLARTSELLDRAIERFRAASDTHGLIGALNMRSWTLFVQGDLDAARSVVNEAIVHADATGDRWSRSSLLSTLGQIETMSGDHDPAVAHLRESCELAVESGDTTGAANYWAALGNEHVLNGDLAAARATYDSVVAQARDQGTPTVQGNIVLGYAVVASRRGDHALAARLHGASIGIHARAGHTIESEPVERQMREDDLAALRARLGDTRFEELSAAGAQLSFDDAVALAHDDAGDGTGGSP